MKPKATKQELQDFILGAAVLSYLENIYYEKYPDGVPELAVFEDELDWDDVDQNSNYDKTAEELVDVVVARLKRIAEKYSAK